MQTIHTTIIYFSLCTIHYTVHIDKELQETRERNYEVFLHLHQNPGLQLAATAAHFNKM